MEQVSSEGKANLPAARVVTRRYEGRSEMRLDCIHWTEDPECVLFKLGTEAEPHLHTCATCKAYEPVARNVRG